LPGLILSLLYLNFATVRRVGLTTGSGETEVGGRRQYRNYLYNLVILVVLILGVLVSLASLVPVPFLPEADPFSTPPGIGPPWYLVAPYALLEALSPWVPEFVAGALLLLLLVLFVLWPVVDRSPAAHWRERLPVLLVGALILLVWLLLTGYGFSLQGAPAP
ncbi:MAG: hypothetical protein ACE5JI_20910, partial [Acidobacteriota bacterium]